MKVFQKGFNYSQDGDGNRLVYHLQGCNMSCPWCANPEGMKPGGVLVADEEWLLESICPYGAVQGKQVNRMLCEDCGDQACITKHSTKGMYWSCEEISPREVVEEALANEMMFYDGGGVTFTGGEATVQFEELKKTLIELKKQGIHTAMETNGTHPRLSELFPYMDQLIMDCKLCDPGQHKKWTGITSEIILENIELAAKEHSNLHVRVPLIGGVNDGKDAQKDFLRFFQEIQGDHVTFEVISYHEFGKKKWSQCGWEYKMDHTAYVDDRVLKEFREAIRQQGCNYKRT